MATFNVNTARAQRLEATGTDWAFEIDGETYTIAVEFELERLAVLRAADEVQELLGAMVGEEQAARLFKHKLSVKDCQAIITAYGQETAVTVGEDSPSES